jgi:hypothetical protein
LNVFLKSKSTLKKRFKIALISYDFSVLHNSGEIECGTLTSATRFVKGKFAFVSALECGAVA